MNKLKGLIKVFLASFLIVLILGLNTGSAFADSSGNSMLKKALANGLLKCYSTTYMKSSSGNTSVTEANIFGIKDLMTENGLKDGALLVPSMIGNTLSDGDVSCFELFNGWDVGLGSGKMRGLLDGKGWTKGTLLNNLGYVQTSSGNDTICISYTYEMRGINNGQTESICYPVDASGKVNTINSKEDTSTRKGGRLKLTGAGDVKIRISDTNSGPNGKQCTPFGINLSGMTKAELESAATEGEKCVNGYEYIKDEPVSRGKVVIADDSKLNLEYVIGNDASVALNNLTGFSSWNDAAFTNQDKYDIYMGYLKHKKMYNLTVSSQCSSDRDTYQDSIPVKINGEVQWCTLNGDLNSNKNANILYSDSNGYGEAQFFKQTNLNGVIQALRALDISQINLTEADPDTGEIDETIKEATDGNEPTVCFDHSGAIGWLICPIIKGIAEVGDYMWGQIETYHLKIPAKDIFQNNSGTMEAWGIVRNIANVLFVLLFMFVIFSQLTGIGIDNYGIKKILPKLIIVAILINLSYVLCELAIDVSNIAGVGINDLLSNAAGEVGYGSGGSTGATVAATGVSLALAGGGAYLWVVLNPLGIVALGLAVLGIVITIVVALVFLYLILIIREAGIILLVVISPIAIACYLLPNTEKTYKKWFDLFKALLIVYPICGAVVGAGKLAGAVLSQIDQPSMKVAAMIIQVLPFFLIPMILRSSLSLMGNIGTRLTNVGRNIGQRGSRGAQSAIRNTRAVQDYQKYNQDRRSLARSERISERLGNRLKNGDTLNARQRSQWATASHQVAAAENQKEREYGEIFDRYERPQVQAEFQNALQSDDAEKASASLTTLLNKGGIDEALTVMDNQNWNRMDTKVRDRLLQTMGSTNVDAMKSYAKYRQTGGQAEFKDWSRGTGTVVAAEASAAASARAKLAANPNASLTDAETKAVRIKDTTYAAHLIENGEHATDSYSKDEMQFIDRRATDIVTQMETVGVANGRTPGYGKEQFGQTLRSMAMNSKDAKAQTVMENIITREIGSGNLDVSHLGLTAESIGSMRGDFARALEQGYIKRGKTRADLQADLSRQIADAKADSRINNRTNADVKTILGM